MTSDDYAWGSTGTTTTTICRTLTRSLSQMCACGQDLDVCSGEHCPRCGAVIEP